MTVTKRQGRLKDIQAAQRETLKTGSDWGSCLQYGRAHNKPKQYKSLGHTSSFALFFPHIASRAIIFGRFSCDQTKRTDVLNKKWERRHTRRRLQKSKSSCCWLASRVL